jgi:hypothetical protein
MDAPARGRILSWVPEESDGREPMSPGEYKELTAFFIDHVGEQLGRHQHETRAFVSEQLGRHQQETRAFLDEQLGRHQQETRAFIDEQLGRHQQETRAFVGVSVEALSHEIRLVADGVLTNRQLIEANGARIDTLTDHVEKLEISITARLADHEERLRVLE